MEKRICLSYLVIVLGSLGLVCQGIGFFVPAWFKFDTTFDDKGFSSGSGNIFGKMLDESLQGGPLEDKKMTIRTSMGLWATTKCTQVEGFQDFESGDKCRTFSNEQLREHIGASRSNTSRVAGLKLMDEFSVLQGLVTFGGIVSLLAVILAGVFVRSSATKGTGFSSAIAWTFGAILIFAAVGLQGSKFKRFNDSIELFETMPEVWDTLQMKSFFPWAIVLSGTGALLNLVAALLIANLACNAQDPNAPGVWHKLSNQAV